MKLKLFLLFSCITILPGYINSMELSDLSPEDQERILLDMSLQEQNSIIDNNKDLEEAVALSLSQSLEEQQGQTKADEELNYATVLSLSEQEYRLKEQDRFEKDQEFIKSHVQSNMYHKIPDNLESKAIYYVKSQQLPDFSCGYNVLYNAYMVERYLGLNNNDINVNDFSKICDNYLKDKNRALLDGLSAPDMKKLSKVLNLRKFKEFILIEQIYKIYESRNPLDSQEMFAVAFFQMQNKDISNIKRYLDHNVGSISVINLSCRVVSYNIPHGILVSLVQYESGQRYLYIYDNCNEPITIHSDIYEHLQYFCKEFKISDRVF